MEEQESEVKQNKTNKRAKTLDSIDEAKEAEDAGTMLMVTFVLAGQTYGGDILQIQEVSGVGHITRVPHVQPFICGVTNLRGNIVPTLDLGMRLGLKTEGGTENKQIMIARTSGGLIGYIVDSVREVITVPKTAIEPTPDDWLDADHKYFVGIAKLEDNLVTLVDFSKVIQSDRVLLDDIKLA